MAPVADGYVAAAFSGAGEFRGLVALIGRPRELVLPQVLVAIGHLEAALRLTDNSRTRDGGKDKGKGRRRTVARGEAAVAKGTALGPLPAARARVLAARLTEDGLSPAGGGRGRGAARTQSREQGGQGSASGRYLLPAPPPHLQLASRRRRPLFTPRQEPPVPLTPLAQFRKRGRRLASPAPGHPNPFSRTARFWGAPPSSSPAEV